MVEISRTPTNFYVAAYDVDSPESLLINLPTEKAEPILNEFSSDFELMACNLKVMDKRLVLLNPKYNNNDVQSVQSQLNS